ncbi:MAG: hypothetical protein B6244_04560 [Candidatus Cloacimonetes bacterium 4572_55]|nr:MAG: hypothetical protein B6244_04560 [Candidatus Cloacimonetes bacterium 4572_55]
MTNIRGKNALYRRIDRFLEEFLISKNDGSLTCILLALKIARSKMIINEIKGPITVDLQPYLPMLKSIVKMYRKYFPSNKMSDEFASFIESLNADDLNKILDNIPSEILEREPYEFTKYNGVLVSDLIECKS